MMRPLVFVDNVLYVDERDAGLGAEGSAPVVVVAGRVGTCISNIGLRLGYAEGVGHGM